MYLSALLERIAALLSLGSAPVLGTRPVSDRASRVVYYVGGNYGQKLERAALAGEVDLSVRSLSELLRAEIGLSIGQLKAAVRSKVATHLLRTSNEKTDTIAALCGFANASRLNKVLVKHTGLTPGQHRHSRS